MNESIKIILLCLVGLLLSTFCIYLILFVLSPNLNVTQEGTGYSISVQGLEKNRGYSIFLLPIPFILILIIEIVNLTKRKNETRILQE